MEFDEIDRKPEGDHETNFYENTRISRATLESTGTSQHEQTGRDEELHDKLRLDRKINDMETFKKGEIPKRVKCFICIILASVIVLYIGIIALIVVVALPKEQDGGWSDWETWGTCSDSCGGGIKSRNRSCSNPTPSLYGKECMGNFEQANLCNQQLCPGTDGGWPNWESWNDCTESCGGGIKSRNRSCSNPAPSILGKQCLGNPEQVSQCNKQLCPGTDGGWSVWEDWGTCTESCGGGVRTRSRSCTSPTPSITGRPCAGDYTDVSTCNKTTCPEYSVAFTAYNIYSNSSTWSIFRFLNTYVNNGDGYDTTTGKFTCNIPGVYHFVVTLTKIYRDINAITAYLRINSTYKLNLRFHPDDDGSNDVGNYMMTGAGTFHLNQNDVVYVYGIPNHFYGGQYSYITGFLITPDQ